MQSAASVVKMRRATWLTGAAAMLLLAFFPEAADGAKRANVVVTGTMAPLKCDRKEESRKLIGILFICFLIIPYSQTVQERCPLTHPFNYGVKDQYCCQEYFSWKRKNISETCDGGRLTWHSHPECCPLDRWVNCPDTVKGCHKHDGAPLPRPGRQPFCSRE